VNGPPGTKRLAAQCSFALGPQLLTPSPVIAPVRLAVEAVDTQAFPLVQLCPLPHAPQFATVRAWPQLSVPLFDPHVAPRRAQNCSLVSGAHVHAPKLQLAPAAQATSEVAYVHVPFEQLPVAAYTRRVVEFAHVAAGGVLHVTPAHGFEGGTHTPFEQESPLPHATGVDAYSHVALPPEARQVPEEA
jgi:hypothetical protein